MKYRLITFMLANEVKERQTILEEFDWKKMFRKEIEDMESAMQ